MSRLLDLLVSRWRVVFVLALLIPAAFTGIALLFEGTNASAGLWAQAAPAPFVAAPVPALQFCFIPALRPVWVASPFLGARIFEHAPPALA